MLLVILFNTSCRTNQADVHLVMTIVGTIACWVCNINKRIAVFSDA
jgi:hypothetical protein